MAEENTLAEVFLSFGGKTLFTLGTACSAIGVVFAIHRITGVGISIFTNLPLFFALKPTKKNANNEQNDDEDILISKSSIISEVKIYSRIATLIAFGVAIKAAGNYLSKDSTAQTLNRFLYK